MTDAQGHPVSPTEAIIWLAMVYVIVAAAFGFMFVENFKRVRRAPTEEAKAVLGTAIAMTWPVYIPTYLFYQLLRLVYFLMTSVPSVLRYIGRGFRDLLGLKAELPVARIYKRDE